MLLQNICSDASRVHDCWNLAKTRQNKKNALRPDAAYSNIARSEQSSHTHVGSHQRPTIFREKKEKEKWTYKGTDKQCVGASLLQSTTRHKKNFAPNFISLSQAVAEKTLTDNVHIIT